jgi:exodeoxyribonuclease X
LSPCPPPGALAGQRIAVVDLDGNGHEPPEIVDLAVLPLDPGPVPVRPATLRTWLVRPARPITPAVTRDAHGIRNCEVFACPAWQRVAAEIHDALDGRVLVAHGAAEHHRMLAAHLPGWRPPLVLDTARLDRSARPRLTGGNGPDRLVAHAGLVPPPVEPGRRRTPRGRRRLDDGAADHHGGAGGLHVGANRGGGRTAVSQTAATALSRLPPHPP